MSVGYLDRCEPETTSSALDKDPGAMSHLSRSDETLVRRRKCNGPRCGCLERLLIWYLLAELLREFVGCSIWTHVAAVHVVSNLKTAGFAANSFDNAGELFRGIIRVSSTNTKHDSLA
jgi:hypothetical protein